MKRQSLYIPQQQNCDFFTISKFVFAKMCPFLPTLHKVPYLAPCLFHFLAGTLYDIFQIHNRGLPVFTLYKDGVALELHNSPSDSGDMGLVEMTAQDVRRDKDSHPWYCEAGVCQNASGIPVWIRVWQETHVGAVILRFARTDFVRTLASYPLEEILGLHTVNSFETFQFILEKWNKSNVQNFHSNVMPHFLSARLGFT